MQIVTPYQQILKDRGGQLRVAVLGKIQDAAITIKSSGNADLDTAVSLADAAIVSRATQFASAVAAGATSITVSDALGLRTWAPYQLTNGRQSETVTFSNVNTSTGVCTLVTASGGVKHSYSATTAGHELRDSYAIYDISTAVAAAAVLGQAYRAEWRLVVGDYAATATGGTTSTVVVDATTYALAYIGAQVVVDLGATYGIEQRTVTAKSGGDTLTVHQDFSEAPAASDPVYIDAAVIWTEQLFDIVRQVLRNPLTFAAMRARCPDIEDTIWPEEEGSEYAPAATIGYSRVLTDLHRLGKRPHLIKGGSDFLLEAVWYATRIVLAEGGNFLNYGVQLGVETYLQEIRRDYTDELEQLAKSIIWEDLDESNSLGHGESLRAGSGRRKR